MSEKQAKIIRNLLALPNGIILLTGSDRLRKIDVALLFSQQHQFSPTPHHHD